MRDAAGSRSQRSAEIITSHLCKTWTAVRIAPIPCQSMLGTHWCTALPLLPSIKKAPIKNCIEFAGPAHMHLLWLAAVYNPTLFYFCRQNLRAAVYESRSTGWFLCLPHFPDARRKNLARDPRPAFCTSQFICRAWAASTYLASFCTTLSVVEISLKN